MSTQWIRRFEFQSSLPPHASTLHYFDNGTKKTFVAIVNISHWIISSWTMNHEFFNIIISYLIKENFKANKSLFCMDENTFNGCIVIHIWFNILNNFKWGEVVEWYLQGLHYWCMECWSWAQLWCMVVGTMAIKCLSNHKLMFQQGDLAATMYKNNF